MNIKQIQWLHTSTFDPNPTFSFLFMIIQPIKLYFTTNHGDPCQVKDTFDHTTFIKVNISAQGLTCFELFTRNPKLTDFEMSPRTKQAAFSLDYVDLLRCFVTLCSM